MILTRHRLFSFARVILPPPPPPPPPPIPAVGLGEIVDYIFKFANSALPQQDSVTGSYFSTQFSGLSRDVLLFNREVNSTVPLSGYWFMITRPVLDSQLLNHPNCLLVINRSEQIKGNPAVIKNLIGDAEGLSIMISGIGAHTSQGLH